MSKYIVAGNWKMNAGPKEASALASDIARRATVKNISSAGGSVVLCPPFLSMAQVLDSVGGTPIQVGAQNCHHEPKGAYTGEQSCSMIKEAGASWVIVGHSERRRDQGETNDLVGKKIRAAVGEGLNPIACIGESLEERKSGQALAVVERQIQEIYASAGADAFSASVIAYEPIWAIGTGEAATPEQAEEVHAHIKTVMRDLGHDLLVLYGGSVKEGNVASIFDMPSIDGALVGGAALSSDEFSAIIQAAEERSQPS